MKKMSLEELHEAVKAVTAVMYAALGVHGRLLLDMATEAARSDLWKALKISAAVLVLILVGIAPVIFLGVRIEKYKPGVMQKFRLRLMAALLPALVIITMMDDLTRAAIFRYFYTAVGIVGIVAFGMAVCMLIFWPEELDK